MPSATTMVPTVDAPRLAALESRDAAVVDECEAVAEVDVAVDLAVVGNVPITTTVLVPWFEALATTVVIATAVFVQLQPGSTKVLVTG